jgi:uncharacterized OB-fold protein
MMFRWFGHISHVSATTVAAFADHLKDGRIMASRCLDCGARSFPPRADCERCRGGRFEFVELSGRGVLHTFTTIVAAPTGFEDLAPYTLGVVDLEEGGRALAEFGGSLVAADVRIGLAVQLVPRLLEDTEDIHVIYAIERAGTTWSRVERAAAGSVQS